MNNTDIDTLSGRELDIAVALELGAVWCVPYHANCKALYLPEDTTTRDIAPQDYPTCKSYDLYISHYSSDVAAAWELDGKWWEWRFTQIYSEGIAAIGAWVMLPESHRWIASVVKAPDFPTKAAAYATARCRAWLKAKYTEKGAL